LPSQCLHRFSIIGMIAESIAEEPMRCDIRPYDAADESAVVALWSEVFAYAAPHNQPRDLIRQKRAYEHALFFVAQIDGRLVGTVMGGYDGHRGWIYSLAVDPSVRGQGIGSQLMGRVELQLAEMGCRKINLQVLPTNAAMVDFYQRLGYAVEQRISMGKLLVPPAEQS
jgi:ribosomal protein S18 acetylase RimI-like enzyme